MTNPGAGLVRFTRAAVLSGLVVLLTVAAHRLGGGSPPSAFALVALTVLLWPVSLLATRRRLRALPLAGGLGAGQLLGHTLLGWLGGDTTAASVSIGCLQHAAHTRTTAACLTDGSAVTHVHAHPQTGLLMVATHALATVVAALLLAHGERLLWRILGLVLRPLPLLHTPAPVLPPQAVTALLVPARADLTLRAGRSPPAYAA